MRVFRNPGHTISSFLAPIPQKPNNTDWRRNVSEGEWGGGGVVVGDHHVLR